MQKKKGNVSRNGSPDGEEEHLEDLCEGQHPGAQVQLEALTAGSCQAKPLEGKESSCWSNQAEQGVKKTNLNQTTVASSPQEAILMPTS